MYRIIATSPNGTPWHHSSCYPSLTRAYMGLEDAIRSERRGNPDSSWDVAERKVAGLPIGWDIKLPNGWSFRIENQEETGDRVAGACVLNQLTSDRPQGKARACCSDDRRTMLPGRPPVGRVQLGHPGCHRVFKDPCPLVG